jgi:hypothetical protein
MMINKYAKNGITGRDFMSVAITLRLCLNYILLTLAWLLALVGLELMFTRTQIAML